MLPPCLQLLEEMHHQRLQKQQKSKIHASSSHSNPSQAHTLLATKTPEEEKVMMAKRKFKEKYDDEQRSQHTQSVFAGAASSRFTNYKSSLEGLSLGLLKGSWRSNLDDAASAINDYLFLLT
ncbi:hypothetical protein NE237_009767 [Protea cynaroides]|uniref:Uncharacterized protein n=1 Tax=Protea cynaroides TaxID=273540 RepID=A0A9Q0R0Y8_9MAGN|nr:hypothetical protein NE237_009767 [Protea cynaroides]